MTSSAAAVSDPAVRRSRGGGGGGCGGEGDGARAALASGAWGFGLLKLGLDGIVVALIPLLTTAGLLLVGALFNSGEVAVDPGMEEDFARFDGPALVLLPASLLVAATGIAVGQRILRRARVPRPRSLGWSTFGIVALPWIVSFAILTFAALGVASDQTYPANDQYWAMWPIFVVAVLVDAAFGAATGAVTTLWMVRARAARAPTAARVTETNSTEWTQ